MSFGQGSTYTGTYTNSSSLQYSNKSNFVIEGLEIGNVSNHCITLSNCQNVVIRNCKLGPTPSRLGVYLYGCSNVTVTNCTFENVASAMIAASCTSNIKFEYNDIKNLQGPSKGGDPAWGQIVQFIEVSGPGHSISYNACENISGESAPEDLINFFRSSGTVDSPIKITNNWLRGGGPSLSGGGIMLGDAGGSYILIENNIVVDPGQYGIGLASGHHITVRNNKIYARQQSFTNVGLYAWEQYGLECHDNTVSNNEVNFKSSSGSVNNFWFASNFGTIAGVETNVYNPNLNASILPTQILGRAFLTTTPTYVWNQTAATSFQTASNWTPARTNPTTKDILQFNSGKSVVVTDIPTQTIGQLQVQNNTSVELRATLGSILTVGSLTVNSGAALNVGAGNQLTVATSLTNDGTLSLLSDNTNGTATILTPDALNGAGTYNVQQYLASGRNWFITSPVKTATAAALSSATSVQAYNESTAKWENVTGSLTVMKGYVSSATKTSGAITFNGSLNNGNQSIVLTRTSGQTNEGFNLVGNPYASYLNLNGLKSNTNLEPTYWYRSKNGMLDAYNILSDVGTSNSGLSVTPYIPPMQAFWLRVKKGTASATFSLNNTLRGHRDSLNNKFRVSVANNAERQLVRLQVTDGINSDESIVYSNADASNAYDAYDSPKMMNGSSSLVPDIYTTVDNEKLVINGMSALPLNTEIPLTFTANQSTSGLFAIKALEVNNLESDVRVILKDKNTGIETNLTDATTTYEFTASAGVTKNFSLIFKTTGVTTDVDEVASQPQVMVYKNTSNQIVVVCKSEIADGSSVSLFNSLGQKLTTQVLNQETTAIDGTFAPGVYLVTVNNGGKKTTSKVLIK